MRDYQVAGLNWLVKLFDSGINGERGVLFFSPLFFVCCCAYLLVVVMVRLLLDISQYEYNRLGVFVRQHY